jgi:hypothetical protein
LHANGYSQEELLGFKEYIHANLIDGICQIIEATRQMGIPFHNPTLNYDADFILDMQRLRSLRRPFDAKMVKALRELWADKAVHEEVLPCREDFHMVESNI